MVQVRRNPLSEALQASAQQIIQLMFAKRRLELEERRLEGEEVREERIREFAERDTNLRSFLFLNERVPEGTTLAEAPDFVREHFNRTFVGDPSVDVGVDPRFAGIELRPLGEPEKFQNQLIIEFQKGIEALSPQERLLAQKSGATARISGLLGAPSELGVRQRRGQIQTAGLELLKNDPREWINAGRVSAGLSPKVRVPLPGGGEITFDTKESGNFHLRFLEMIARQNETRAIGGQLAARFFQEDAKAIVEMLDKRGISVSPLVVKDMMTLSPQTIARMAASPELEADPRGIVAQLMNQGYVGVQGAFNLLLEQLPMGDDLAAGVDILSTLNERGVTGSSLLEMSESLTRLIDDAAKEAGIEGVTPLIKSGVGFWRGGRAGFEVPQRGPGIETLGGTAARGRVVPRIRGTPPEEAAPPRSSTPTPREVQIQEAFLQIVGGETTLGKAMASMDLTQEEVKLLRSMIAQAKGPR